MHSISISLTTLIGAAFWIAGIVAIGLAVAEMVPVVWAAAGVALVIMGNAIYLRGVVRAAEERVAALYKTGGVDIKLPRSIRP